MVFAIWASCPARGQNIGSIERQDVAGARPQAGTRPALKYDPAALRFGDILVLPSVTFSTDYFGNVSGRIDLTQEDVEFVITPRILAETDWGRHEISAQVTGKISRFARYGVYNANEYSANLAGRYDIDDRTTLSPSIGYARDVERYGLNGTSATFNLNSTSRTAGSNLSLQHKFGQFDLSAVASYRRVTYEDLPETDGVDVSQSFRDMRSIGGTAHLGYNIGPSTALILTYSVQKIRSLHPTLCCRRDATEQSATAGLVFNPHGLFDGGVEIGYLEERFKNPNYRNFNGLTYTAHVDWYPTELITVSASTGRSLSNSGIIDVGVLVTDTTSANIDYELLRNLLVRGKVSYIHDEYREIGTSTSRLEGTISADYSFNTWASLGIYVSQITRHSSNVNRLGPASVAQGGVSLTLYP